jgi:hypothetical protein
MQLTMLTPRNNNMNAKLFHGPLGERFFIEKDKHNKDLMLWALNTKIGDHFNGCDDYNHIIIEIVIKYYIIDDEGKAEKIITQSKKTFSQSKLDQYKNWSLYEVCFLGEDGMAHYCPGGALPPKTYEQIKSKKSDCNFIGLKWPSSEQSRAC